MKQISSRVSPWQQKRMSQGLPEDGASAKFWIFVTSTKKTKTA
jgi:hypothetical protein